MMDEAALFYTLNAISGLVLFALGFAAAFSPNSRYRSALAYALMAWGVHLAFSNAWGSSNDSQTATLLIWLAIILAPLQGILFLAYASERATQGSGPRLLHLAQKWGYLIVATILAVAWIPAAIFAHDSILTVQAAPSGDGYSVDFGALSPFLIDGPKFLGAAFALLLLGRQTSLDSRKDLLILRGLSFAWAYSMGYPLATEIKETTSFPLLVILVVAIVAIIVATLLPGVQVVKGDQTLSRRQNTVYALLIAAVAILPWWTVDASGWPWALLAPGSFRLLAAIPLALALGYHGIAKQLSREPKVRVKAILLELALLSAIIATILLRSPQISTLWDSYALGLALASLSLVLAFAFYRIGLGFGAIFRPQSA